MAACGRPPEHFQALKCGSKDPKSANKRSLIYNMWFICEKSRRVELSGRRSATYEVDIIQKPAAAKRPNPSIQSQNLSITKNPKLNNQTLYKFPRKDSGAAAKPKSYQHF